MHSVRRTEDEERETGPLDLLRNEDLPEHLRPSSYNIEAYDGAILDPKGLEKVSGTNHSML